MILQVEGLGVFRLRCRGLGFGGLGVYESGLWTSDKEKKHAFDQNWHIALRCEIQVQD